MAKYPDRSSESRRTAGVRGWGWWFGQLLLTVIAGFFVCFGIAVLAASYDLNDPFSFVMTFFAASLIILISLVMVMAFVLRMWRASKAARRTDAPEEGPP